MQHRENPSGVMKQLLRDTRTGFPGGGEGGNKFQEEENAPNEALVNNLYVLHVLKR